MKVIDTQKLNALKKFCSCSVQVQYVIHLLLCTNQDDIRLCAEHFAVTVHQFLQSFFVVDSSSLFKVSGISGTYTSSFTEPHRKMLGGGVRFRDGGGQAVDPPTPLTVHLSGNCLFQNVVSSLWMCGDTPSCSKTAVGFARSNGACHGR